jgi:uncharacterized RDD family membrane protein YckC
MNWYYVDSGRQVGPVDDAQLQTLARSGKILNDTLVWHEGMDNWRMFAETNAPGNGTILEPTVAAPPQPSLAPGEAVCAECGKVFNRQDMIPHAGIYVCAGCKPVFMQKLAEGARLNTGALSYAGFWVRAGAKILDGLIIGVIFIPAFIYFAVKGASIGQPNRFQVIQLLVEFLYMAANIGYQIFFLGKYGATLGKMACGLRVVTPEGGAIGYGRATGRAFADILSGMICDIGYLIVVFDNQKRALHDYICSTRVIHK